MVSTALILLAGRYSSQVAIPTCIILAREIAVSALREWMASRGIRNLVQVDIADSVTFSSFQWNRILDYNPWLYFVSALPIHFDYSNKCMFILSSCRSAICGQ
jgi:hypothetical protein